MSGISGDKCKVTLSSGYTANGLRWSSDVAMEEVDKTSGWDAANPWREYDTGWGSWSITFECRIDSATALTLAGSTVTFSGYGKSTTTPDLTGTIIITGGPNMDIERYGEAIVRYTGRGTGLPVVN